MSELVRRLSWPARASEAEILDREWIVTNGLGGYSCGTVAGIITRRFHGILIAALPAPLGRRMMLNELSEELHFPNGRSVCFGGEQRVGGQVQVRDTDTYAEFRVEDGLPVWKYVVEGITIEKRLVMPHRQNTVHINYRVTCGDCNVRLRLRPAIQFRPHEGLLGRLEDEPYTVTVVGDHYEFSCANLALPPLRMLLHGSEPAFTFDRMYIKNVLYSTEQMRGYEAEGDLWSPGYFHAVLTPGQELTLVASTETWETVKALGPGDAFATEAYRRQVLLSRAHPQAQSDLGAELVLAADQFVITPTGRIEDVARARAAGNEVRTIIAGYHWFTDWGRDTMISLEGLTLTTGRFLEAGWILRTFAYYVKDGLIPNMFPEGEKDGLYHTADATLWFFHALDRYIELTQDRATLRMIMPKLVEIVQKHLDGTRFGIGVDASDGLVRQGAPGYQLTWMDAKVDDWVVTPRRGKAVEINALWYNALRLMEGWAHEVATSFAPAELADHAARARESFNRRFWYADGGYLYDVIDREEGGDDPACRPNQLLSFSLKNPVLDESKWSQVLSVAQERLLTPVGLRSLAPGSPDYKEKYYGDLRSRDAAYHQGTVWGWLIGPFIDAWLKVHPDDRRGARKFLDGFGPAMEEGAIGSISEIFDAEAPYTQRGCIAQAWSVAEVLRCWVKTA